MNDVEAEKELLELLKNKHWRMNHLYHIINKDGDDEIFRFNAEQNIVWDKCFKDGILISDPNILKSRQLGITTFFALIYFDDVCWGQNLNAYIQSHDNRSIEKIFRIIKYAHRKMEPEIQPNLDRGGGSRFEYYFPDNNCRIYVGLENRSSTVHRLHLSEVAFQDKDRIAATMGALPPKTKYSSETTPNGMNWYQEDWNIVVPHRTNIFFPWFTHAKYALDDLDTGRYYPDEIELIERVKRSSNTNLTKGQIEFRRKKILDLKSLDKFNQEYPEDEASCFLQSGESVLDLHNIQKLISQAPMPRMEGDFKIYKEFDKSGYYVCGADVAEGLNQDNSAATIFNVKTREQVASFAGSYKPSEFAEKLVEFCNLYTKSDKMPVLGIERNNHGHAVILKLNEVLFYTNLYKAKDDKLGWLTSSLTRPIMVDMLIEAIDDNSLGIYDVDLLKECLTLVNKSGKIQAEEGKKDDRFMACAIAVQLLIENTSFKMYDNIDKYIMM